MRTFILNLNAIFLISSIFISNFLVNVILYRYFKYTKVKISTTMKVVYYSVVNIVCWCVIAELIYFFVIK